MVEWPTSCFPQPPKAVPAKGWQHEPFLLQCEMRRKQHAVHEQLRGVGPWARRVYPFAIQFRSRGDEGLTSRRRFTPLSINPEVMPGLDASGSLTGNAALSHPPTSGFGQIHFHRALLPRRTCSSGGVRGVSRMSHGGRDIRNSLWETGWSLLPCASQNRHNSSLQWGSSRYTLQG